MSTKTFPIPIVESQSSNSTNPQSKIPSEDYKHRKILRKVLLIQPPAYCNNAKQDMNPNAPLGIAYIAAVLEKDGYEVAILDAFIEGWHQEERITPDKLRVGLFSDQISQRIREFNPDVVGVTSMFTSQRQNAHNMAKLAKEIDPEIFIIFGGAHATSATQSVLEDKNVDVVVLGEGDNLITPLIKAVELGQCLSTLDGLSYRSQDGKYVEISKTTIIEDLDTIPFPARHLLPMQKYFDAKVRHGGESRGQRAVSMITSRGCQYLCNFCTAFKVFTRKPRMRSIENVQAEIDYLISNYAIDEIFFEDDQIIAKQRRAGDLFDAIGKYKLFWDTPNGVSPWLLNLEILKKMKDAGCYRINLAIESGNQWVLDNIINKPVKLNKIPQLINDIRSLDMEVTTFLVVGNISENNIETLDQIRESFEFCRKLNVPTHVSLLTAYPGSEVLEIAEKKGYLVPGFNWDDLIIQKFQLQTPLWSPQELMDFVEKERLKTRWGEFMANPVSIIISFSTRLFSAPRATLNKIFFVLVNSVRLLTPR